MTDLMAVPSVLTRLPSVAPVVVVEALEVDAVEAVTVVVAAVEATPVEEDTAAAVVTAATEVAKVEDMAVAKVDMAAVVSAVSFTSYSLY